MREIVEKALKNRKCILCGKNERAELFYEKYKSRLNITGVTAILKKELRTGDYLNDLVLDKSFEEVCQGEEYLIICLDSFVMPYLNCLERYGKKEFADYIFVDSAEAVLSEKEICLFMGSLLLEQIGFTLANNSIFAKKYYSKIYSENRILKTEGDETTVYKEMGKLADIYIYSSSDIGCFKAKILMEDELKKGAKTISVSDATFNGYFPQHACNRLKLSKWLYLKKIYWSVNKKTVMMSREDLNITRLIEQGIDEKTIIKEIKREDFYSSEEMDQNMSNALERVRMSDLESDIAVKDLLEKNMKLLPYRNLDEVNMEYLNEIIEMICEKINIKYIPTDISTDLFEKETGSELIVYPCVQKHFGLLKKDNYRIQGLKNCQYVSFEEYLQIYIQNIINIKELERIMSKDYNLK